MSSIRLLILGVLLRKQPIHGYDVRRELEILHADRWANIAYGSIYSALSKMAEEGLVIPTSEGEKQTTKTEYCITTSGKAEFERLLHEYWWEAKPMVDPFQIALAFMDKLSPHELQEALRHRASTLHTSLNDLRTSHEKQTNSHPAPHASASIRLMQAHLEVELQWIGDMLCRLENGEPI